MLIVGAGPDVDQAARAAGSAAIGALADRKTNTLQHDATGRLVSVDIVSPQVFVRRTPVEVALTDAVRGQTPSLPGRWPVPWDNPAGPPVG